MDRLRNSSDNVGCTTRNTRIPINKDKDEDGIVDVFPLSQKKIIILYLSRVGRTQDTYTKFEREKLTIENRGTKPGFLTLLEWNGTSLERILNTKPFSEMNL